VRDAFGWTWDDFSKALRQTAAGNGGALMLPWFEPEITPSVQQPSVVRVGLDGATPAQHVRAIIEAQMLALSVHSAWMGVTPEAIVATGGAAANRDILQVMADVFAADVHQFDANDSAALGAALRSWQADSGLDWPTVVRNFATPPVSGRLRPVADHVRLYQDLQRRYIALEADALA
jgi:xylulokinase